MLLALDVGNTNVHLGLWNGDHWQISWRARTVQDKMPDEYAVLVRNFLGSAGYTYDVVTGVIIASVVPPLTMAFTELVQRYLRQQPVVVSHRIHLGIGVDVDQPEQVGADRLVNTAAVQAKYGGPAISVDFGTSTNFDVLTGDGCYVGGAIAPGIGVSHDALVSRAARLHKVDLLPPPSAIGRNTIHAMQSGLFLGHVAMVEGILARLKVALAVSVPVRVIATGGLSALFKEHTDSIDVIEPELTLDGLRILYELNR